MRKNCTVLTRGLGAIQPGVNRCKLLADSDFDQLYIDCTTQRWPDLYSNTVNRVSPPQFVTVGLYKQRKATALIVESDWTENYDNLLGKIVAFSSGIATNWTNWPGGGRPAAQRCLQLFMLLPPQSGQHISF